jgi:hypothetical protein
MPAAGTGLPAPTSSAIALKVADNTMPSFAVGGTSSPIAGTLSMDIQATDTGSGLRAASATLGRGPPRPTSRPARTAAT